MADSNKVEWPKSDILNLIITTGVLARILAGECREVVRSRKPANSVPGGESLILSYYDGNHYVCTLHELRTKDGRTPHRDAVDFLWEGIRYVRKRA